jgi:SAM-dependent methyltransferase
VAAAAAASPLVTGPAFSAKADADELRFREQIEPELRGDDVVGWLERKELLPRLAHVLDRAGLEPRGVVVEFGAGTCWLTGALALYPAVERAIGVEFSRRRLEELAPVALAAMGAPAERVERRVADFFASGLPPQSADLVVFDAAFHHASDMDEVARVAHDLLRPGGAVLLFREPTLALLRRGRDHGVEDEHGSFEHEDTARGYERRLRAAGFTDVRRVPAAGSFRGAKARAILRPPLAWLNGFAFAEFAYVGRRTSRSPS